jgi:fatty-acyl-CoA synthase
MKLSFSTKGWHNDNFDGFCRRAVALGFGGIELHNISNALFTDKSGNLLVENAPRTRRELYEQKLDLPCLDALADIADDACRARALQEVGECITIAEAFKIPYVRIKTQRLEADAVAKTADFVRQMLPNARRAKVVLLIETAGVFADTGILRSLLEQFADDNLAALWNLSAAYFGKGESAEEVIRNLGAYVCHVHVNDAVKEGDGFAYRLMGEGDLPLGDIMLALRSVNYEGYMSLVWDPTWCEALSDEDIIMAQYAEYMRQYDWSKNNKCKLYHNNAGTGVFVWKKETLIDATFSQVLDKMVEEFPDQYAFKYTTLDYTRTYTEFRQDVDTFARALVAMGVKAGSHVAVWASNVPQWYIAFWATVKLGAVLVTVNTAYKIHEIEYLLKQSDTHTLIMTKGAKDTDYGATIAELCPELADKAPEQPLHAKRLPFLRNVITVGYRQAGCLTWEEAWAMAKSVSLEKVLRMAALVDKHDVCNMQYTSGTTGFPKGVMLTHYNIVNNGKAIGDRMDLSTADRMMVQVPMFHCFGMVLAMTASMTHGVTLCPLPYFSAKSSLACINAEHITAFHGVPTMFIAMLEHPDFAKTDFSYMRTGIMAGSPCPISTMRQVVDQMNMREITIVYGQTEASPGCTMSSTDDPIEVRVATVGRPLPDIECRIVNPETGEDCPDNVTGEFLARGYNLMKGYYKMPQATAETIDKDGWLHTGDLACRTEEGNYRITGRLKDMIIRGGENIYPKELEEFILTHPKVSDVQVVGVPDKQYGEEVTAFVILKAGETLTEGELKAYMLANIARHKVPRYIVFVDTFPMNAAGKILKYKLREQATEYVKALSEK